MHNNNESCCETGTRVTVNVDVTNIVKYACIAGAVIVTVIFAARCCMKYLNQKV